MTGFVVVMILEQKDGVGMTALQAKLMDMTKDLSEDTMQLLIGLVQQIVIPMENKAAQAKSKERAAGRIGFMEGVDFIESDYDIDEYNSEIAKMFGVAEI